MSENTSLESALLETTEDNKEQSLENPKVESPEKFKDSNEVAANVDNAAIEHYLNQIIDPPESRDATKDNTSTTIVNEEQIKEPNMTTNSVSNESQSSPTAATTTTTSTDNNQITAAANNSLSLLAQYDSNDSSSSSTSDTESSSMEVDSADSESSLSSDESEKSLTAIKKKIDEFEAGGEEEDDDDGEEKQSQAPIKAIGELGMEDLPPIEDLYITVPEKECNLLGKITSIVDQLVLVESLPNVVPLDLDTVLFLDKGQRPLGKVFDVMGQVHCPIYCVRFNTNKDIQEKGINVGLEVYCAPSAPCTSIVILPDLMKHKGSDASWKNDIEPPARFVEYSDDEQERNAHRPRRNGREPPSAPTEEHIPPRNGHPGNHTYHRARRGGGNGNRQNSHHASFNYPRPNHHHMPVANHMHHQPQYYYPPPGSSATIYPNPFAQPDPRYYVNPFAYAPTVNYPPFDPNLFNGPPPPPPPPQN